MGACSYIMPAAEAGPMNCRYWKQRRLFEYSQDFARSGPCATIISTAFRSTAFRIFALRLII